VGVCTHGVWGCFCLPQLAARECCWRLICSSMHCQRRWPRSCFLHLRLPKALRHELHFASRLCRRHPCVCCLWITVVCGARPRLIPCALEWGCGSAFGELIGPGWPWLSPFLPEVQPALWGLPVCGGRLPRRALPVPGWQAPLLRVPRCNSSWGDSIPAVLARLPDILRLLQILFIYTGGFGLCELSSFR